MSTIIKNALLVSTAASAMLAMPAFAAEVEESGASAGEIIVTARRSEERLQDVPISITVFNQEQLDNRNIVTAGDIATYTPSLTANNRFGSNNTSFSIRGFTQEQSTSPSVAVYFADVVAPRSNGSTPSGNGAGAGAFFDLQNVQVLKGPQGTLFGRNTTGGAILLVPQKPTNNLEGYVEGSIGNYDMRRVQAVVNIPLADTFRVRIGMDRQKRDGYLRNVSGIGPKTFDDVDYMSVRASMVADLTPELENYTIFSWGKSDTNGSYPKVFANTPGRTTPRTVGLVNAQIAATTRFYDIMNHLVDAKDNAEQWQVINTTTWLANDSLTIKNIASYSEVRTQTVANVFGDYGVLSTSPLLVFQFGAQNRNPKGAYGVAQSTFTEELQLQGSAFGDRLTYQMGLYLEISDPLGVQSTFGANGLACTNIDLLQCVDIGGRDQRAEGRSGRIIDSETQYWFNNKGAYAQATYDLTEQLSVTGGIRYTSDKTRGYSQLVNILFPAENVPSYGCPLAAVPGVVGGTPAQVQADQTRCNLTVKFKTERPTWLLGLDFKPTPDILIYAKYARGYRQGGLNAASAAPPWGPEKVDTYEIGAKTSFDGFVSGYFNIAAFHNDFTDQQLQLIYNGCLPANIGVVPTCPTNVVPQGSTSGVGNAGKSQIKGIEVDGAITPVTGLNLNFAYSYLDTKLKSIVLPAVPLGFASVQSRAVTGAVLPQVPKHKLTLTGSYTLPLDESLGDMTFSATYSYQTKSLVNFQSPVGQQFSPNLKNLNLNFNWKSVGGSPFDFAAFVTNVTKEKEFVNYTAGSFGFNSAVLSQPRFYGVRLRYNFGR